MANDRFPTGDLLSTLRACSRRDSLHAASVARIEELEAAAAGLREACEGIDRDYMTSDEHHPGYVLIPTAKFDAIRAALLEKAPSISYDALAAAQGTSASGQDPKGLEAKPAGPVHKEDAPNG